MLCGRMSSVMPPHCGLLGHVKYVLGDCRLRQSASAIVWFWRGEPSEGHR